MAITNSEAIRFSNERARVFADILLQSIETADAIAAEWNSNSMTSIVPNTTEVLVDGSEIDGRHPATGAKLYAMVAAATDLSAWGATGSPTRKDRLRTFAVNGASRF